MGIGRGSKGRGRESEMKTILVLLALVSLLVPVSVKAQSTLAFQEKCAERGKKFFLKELSCTVVVGEVFVMRKGMGTMISRHITIRNLTSVSYGSSTLILQEMRKPSNQSRYMMFLRENASQVARSAYFLPQTVKLERRPAIHFRNLKP